MAFIACPYKKISLEHAKEILESDSPIVSTRYNLDMAEEFYIPCGQIENYISLYDGTIDKGGELIRRMVVGLSGDNRRFIPLSYFRGRSIIDYVGNFVSIEVSRGWKAETTPVIEIFNKLIEDNMKYDLRLYIREKIIEDKCCRRSMSFRCVDYDTEQPHIMEEQLREELRKKREFERKQKEEEQKKKDAILLQKRAKEERILRLKASVDNWGAIRGLPFYFFYYYYPNRTEGISQTSSSARRLIWNFKDGTYDGKAIRILKELIAITFGANDRKALTFVCVPASTRENNIIRYERFSRQICTDLGMRNAFPYITINNEKEESHLGGNKDFDLSFDEEFFKDANIILFDDVVTQGHSIHFMQQRLEAIGANVICAISFGRTADETNDEPHPYTGEM